MMDFFGINIKILKLAGLWMPLDEPNRNKRLAIRLFNYSCLFYSIIYFTVAEFVALPESSANINDLVKNLNMSMSFLLTFFKVSVWLYNRKTIINIMKTLDKSWKAFEAIDDFEPSIIIQKEKKLKDTLTYTFFVIACTVPSSACLLTFVNVFTYEQSNSNSTEFHFKLPYNSFVPFNYKASKVAYSIAVLYQCLALLSCGTITVGFDMLYTSLVNCTSAHFKLLQGAFRTIRATSEKNVNLSNINKKVLDIEMDKQMAKRIQHLQLIVGICEKLETIFTYLILLQILVSLIVFCTCLYLVSSIPMGSNVFGNEIAYMLAIENQLALYCYAGNKLTFRGEGMVFAIYSIDWYETTNKFKKNMIFTMMRMGKPIHLTAGKFTPLTLATFVTIGRGSYSLLAVLKNG